jgi:hypothetical protein
MLVLSCQGISAGQKEVVYQEKLSISMSRGILPMNECPIFLEPIVP